MEIKNSLLQSPMKKPFRSTKETRFQFQCFQFQRRYNLLIKAKGLIANNPSVAYAFSDINCSLVLKFNDNTYRYFNSESELNNLLNPEFKRD